MDKDIVKEILKNQIDLLKIYSAFIIGLIFFTFVVIAFIYSFITIIKLTKALKK